MSGHDTAKVMRPRPLAAAVQNDTTDLPSPELLWDWRETQDRIDLAVGQEPDRIAFDPIDVPTGVEANLEQDHGEKEVVRRSLVQDRHRFALEVPDRPDTVRPEQLNASDVRTAIMTIGSPASTREISEETNVTVICASPRASVSNRSPNVAFGKY
jgi:hypothetical protein